MERQCSPWLPIQFEIHDGRSIVSQGISGLGKNKHAINVFDVGIIDY